MGTTIKSVYRVDNGTDFDIYHYETETSQVKTTNGSTVDVELELAKEHSIYRQAVINDNFDVWQRGTSFSTSGIYTADRWFITCNGSGIAFTITKQSLNAGDLNNKSSYFLRYQMTNAGSGNTQNQLIQGIENVRNFAGTTCTVSFYAKADSARTITMNFDQNFGSGGSATSWNVATQANFNLTTSWQKFTATFTIPDITGKTIGTSSYLRFWFGLPYGVTSTIDIAQVQINQGTVALPFVPKSYDDELRLCQRYFEKSYVQGVAIGTTGDTNGVKRSVTSTAWDLSDNGHCTFKVTKRTIPTVTTYSVLTGATGKAMVDVDNVDITVNTANIGDSSFGVCSSGGGFTVGKRIQWHWTADSEL